MAPPSRPLGFPSRTFAGFSAETSCYSKIQKKDKIMIESTTLLVGIVTALATLGIGYWSSFSFFSSKHAATNKNGDFGGPRGGIFALMGGLFAGILFFSIFGKTMFTPAVNEVGLIASMIGGFLGGIIGMLRAPRWTKED